MKRTSFAIGMSLMILALPASAQTHNPEDIRSLLKELRAVMQPPGTWTTSVVRAKEPMTLATLNSSRLYRICNSTKSSSNVIIIADAKEDDEELRIGMCRDYEVRQALQLRRSGLTKDAEGTFHNLD